MNELEHPALEALDVTAVLFALSDPARLAIVRQVAQVTAPAEATCQAVAMDMPKSTRSHHLKVLREAGVLRMTLRGREKVITLRSGELQARWPGLLDAVLGDPADGVAGEAAGEVIEGPAPSLNLAGSLRFS